MALAPIRAKACSTMHDIESHSGTGMRDVTIIH